MISINAIKLDNILLSLYVALNFADRKIAYFFLIALLLKCIYNYFFISKNKHSNIILAVGLFSAWISLSAYINNVPLHELDNYFRFLLLLPLLFINLKNTNLQGIIFFSFIFAGLNLIYTYSTSSPLRYTGTSNNAITYASMCSVMILLCFYDLINKKYKSSYLATYGVVIVFFTFCIVLTESRGPILGLIPSVLAMFIIYRNFRALPIIIISILLVSFTNNPISERFERLSIMKDISKDNINQIQYASMRERLIYNIYGLETLKENFIFGIGAQNVESDLSDYVNKKQLNAFPRDHLHNDFLDISVKFGLPSLIFLILIYYFIIKNNSKRERIGIIFSLILFLLISQLTQSQFAHSQITTIIITLMYVFSSYGKTNKIN